MTMPQLLRRQAPQILLVLACLLVLPALASSGDTVAAPDGSGGTRPAEEGHKSEAAEKVDCSEPLKDARGKPTEKYDKRCTEEMIKAAKARKADGKPAEYDLEAIEGLEGLGQSSESGQSMEPGTLEDLFGLGPFDPAKAFERQLEEREKKDEDDPSRA